MVGYNIQRYHNDPEYKKRIREKEKARFDRWLKSNPDYHKQYYRRNKEHMNNYANQYHEELFWTLKRELIMIIQKRIGCDLCPITDIKVLEFHHINVNGDIDRKRFTRECHKKGDFDRIKWLRYMIKHYYKEKDTYPLQVLCSNCHRFITLKYGHNNKRPEEHQITLTNFI